MRSRYFNTYQSEETGRISHTIDVDQILVTPVLAERNSVSESMVLSHTVTTSRVLCAANGLGECDVHHVLVQRRDWHVGCDKVVRSWWVGEYDRFLRVRLIRGHLDEPMSLILRQETWRTGSTSGRCSAPKDVVRLVLPCRLHVINILDLHVDRVPSVRVSLCRREVIMARNENVRIAHTLRRREHRV